MKWIIEILAGLAFLVGVFGLVHQRFITNAGWFVMTDFLTHEAAIAMAFTAVVGLLVGKYLGKLL